MRTYLYFAVFLALFSVAAKAEETAESRCADFRRVQLPGVALQLTKTTWVASAPEGPDPQKHLPGYCRVDGILDRRTGVDGTEYGIGFALALPEDWNHDFLMQGGGGLNGTVQEPLGATAAGDTPALARHFAVVTTDTGHKSTQAFDASFFRDQQATLDFDYQAIGKVAELSKQLLARYYGREASFSYYVGCSTGGREGMIMTQRYPAYFNGVISGAPAMRTGFSNLADRWAAASLNRIAPKDANGDPVQGGGLSDGDRKLIVDAAVKRCDARDGIADGMIFDAEGCDFDPAVLTCNGAKTAACLTNGQVNAVKTAFAGPKDSRGFQPYPGFFYDTGIAAVKGIPGLLRAAPGPVGPRRPATEIDVDREELSAPNPLTDAVYRNLSTFSGRGGKLIFYHGVSDPWFSARDTIEYYNGMSQENGGHERVMNWSRLFLVPGMGHCGGGEAALDHFDLLTAVVNWVEKAQAPSAVVATGKAFPGRSRPLCAYPAHAQYEGHGNSENAASFVCRED